MQMTYNNRDGCYHGTWSDGREFTVDGDVFSEARRDYIHDCFGVDADFADDATYDQATNELCNPSAWDDDHVSAFSNPDYGLQE